MSIEQPLGGSTGGDGGNTITDRQLFDQAISDPTPAPAPSQSPQSPSDAGGAGAPVPSTRPDLQQPAQAGQPRDPQGKFARPAQGQQPQPQRQQPGQQPGGGQRQQPEDHRVPLRELLAERDARQRLEAHAAELTRAVMELQQRTDPNQPKPQPQGPETIFDDPRQYLDANVMEPLRQEGQRYMMQIKDGMSREFANTQFTQPVVDAALAAMAQFRHTPQGNFVFQQIMQSGHPYGELVKWHRQQVAFSAIGADPHAWLRKMQEQWLDDPNAQKQMIARIQRRQSNGGAQGAQGRPNVQLPPSLSTVPSTANRAQAPGDLSSESLYAFATK